jgi:hypothetical protein
MGSIANLCIGMSQNWDNLLFHKEKACSPISFELPPTEISDTTTLWG